MNEDLQRLISDYLNGDLSAEDSETLRGRLASDPKALTEFVQAIDLHAELRKVFLEGKGSLQAQKEIRQARRSRLRLIAGSLAASAAAAAAILIVWLFISPTKSGIRLESLAGRVRLIAGESRVDARPGQQIPEGQGLETFEGARATLKYPDGTSLDLGPRTEVSEFTRSGVKRVALSRGSLTAQVSRQPVEHPMTFATPQGEAKVLGTSLKLEVDADPEKGSTRLEVTSGRVRLTRLKGGESVEVAADHFAVATKELPLELRALATPLVAELVQRMAPNSWLTLPDTRLRRVVPDPAQYPKTRGISGPKSIMDSWSGGVLDAQRNRLMVWGGGHTNYYGNELYAFDLGSLKWERLTDPTAEPAVGRQINADGTPIARATYNGLACIAHADRMFALGGDTAGSGATPDFTWTFDFATKAWENRSPSGDRPPTWVGNCSAYDPQTRKIWWGEGRTPNNAGLYSYDFDGNRWTKHARDQFYYQTSAVDLRRGLLVCVGDGKLFAHDVRGASAARRALQTSGGAEFIAKPNPGWDYDAGVDRLVGWAGGAVQVLNLETNAWKSYDAPGAPKATQNGIYGRWRYVPSLDVFVVVTGIDDDVHFYKLPAGE
jgi:ferric-dicitrate binding protein FerR (iron transport regulator)